MSMLERVVGAGAGILLVILAVPMIVRCVRPNLWYGVRTTETLSDDRVWYEANAKSGWGFLILGAAITVLAFITDSEPLFLGVALMGGVAWGAWSVWLGRNAYRKREGRQGH